MLVRPSPHDWFTEPLTRVDVAVVEESARAPLHGAAIEDRQPGQAQRTGVDAETLRDLEEYALVRPARDGTYSQDDIEIVRTCLRLQHFGMGARHVRHIHSAVERAAGLVEQVLAASGSPGTGPAVIAVELPDGYLLRGFGPEVFAPDPAFLVALGSAAVRSYERDLLADESRRAEELAAIDRARTALLASVGHDLRTPLTTVRIGLDSLRSPQAVLSDADRAELLDSIDAATSRLDDLITNLLDMSRLQAGTVIARVRPTVLADAVDQALLATPSDRVVVQLPDGLPPVLADAALLERIVANLVSNALRYSPSGSPVEVRARHDASTVVLEVADRGPGMPTADLTSAFTGLRHVGEHADGGSGLGLAIVRGFAEAMSMTAELRPRAGGGLVARVVIPRSAPEVGR